MQWLGEALVIIIQLIVHELFGRYAWPWWTLATLFAAGALWWTSWPLAVAAAIVSAMRLAFAWLETKARTLGVDGPPPDRRGP
ncbi:MAG: hypothetical protein QM674_18260 [Burkholderiaceae bacterium]